MRLEELDKFRGVHEGNANDLERFAELLDTLIVKLCDAGQEGELGAGSLYVSLLQKRNEQLIVKYQDWLRERQLEGNVRNLHAFVNDEAESWMVALETVKGFGQQKAKALSTGRTLAVTQMSLKKKSVLEKCKLCSNEHGLWQCTQFKALPVEKRWDKAREVQHAGEAGVVQLMDVIQTIIVCYTTGYRKQHLQWSQWIIRPGLYQMQNQSMMTVPHRPETAGKGSLD